MFDKLYVTVPVWFACVTLIIGVALGFFHGRIFGKAGERRRKSLEKEIVNRKRRQRLDTQENLGNRFYNGLVEAAVRNPHASRIGVERLKTGDHLMVSVTYRDDAPSSSVSDLHGYPIVRISLNLLQEGWRCPIIVYVGPYPSLDDGTEQVYEATNASVAEAFNRVVPLVRDYAPVGKSTI